MKAYKLCKFKNGKLYPLFVGTENELPMNEWMKAEEGKKTENGKVKSKKLGELAYRPGWHCSDIPYAGHIGVDKKSGVLKQALDTVWVEIEINDKNNYTEYCKSLSKSKFKQCLDHIPSEGYYEFRTNGNVNKNVIWYITSDIKINRVLSFEEVKELCLAKGVQPQPLMAV